MLRANISLQRGEFSLAAELTAPARGISVIFGPSGCGKTTLLRCIAGLDHASGNIALTDVTWQDSARRFFMPPHLRRAALVFQDARLFTHRNVAGNLDYAAKRSAIATARRNEIIDLLDIGPLLQRRCTTLSGGERQRVAIARALLADPQLLLLDEPLAALDADRKSEILPYLASLRTQLQLPMLYVTHNLDELLTLADHLILMRDGKITAHGPAEQLLSNLDSTLARRDDASTVLNCRIVAHQQNHHLTELELLPGAQPLNATVQHLLLPQTSLPVGSHVRLRVQARDVSIALDAPQRSSIINILPATIDAIGEPGSNGQQLVRLTLQDQKLLARISVYSAQRLQLRAGMNVYAQIKGMALVANSLVANPLIAK
jgi:molybdate transport system ATP-binding protein